MTGVVGGGGVADEVGVAQDIEFGFILATPEIDAKRKAPVTALTGLGTFGVYILNNDTLTAADIS